MVNLLSAITSALTVMFLFWTITNLAGKAMIKENSSDSFWFSAVEAEVYAFSSFTNGIKQCS